MTLAAPPPAGALEQWLADLIARRGPLTVADYMLHCLHHPQQGYYTARPALGARGDFITAPLVSQMFGELIGLWAAEVWRALGRPTRFRLVELGPGDGTMIADVLRAGRAAPGFLAAAQIVLVERSEFLVERQHAAVEGHAATWLESFSEVGDDLPVIVLANEFLDCLPIRQAVRAQDSWAERGVGVDDQGRLAFALLRPRVGTRAPPAVLGEAPAGSVFEWSPLLELIGAEAGSLVARARGAALFIDYGRDAPALGDTLQSIVGHRRVDPLAAPGEADITAQVDFPRFLASARNAGAIAPAVRAQGDFLRDLGIEARAAALSAARPDLAEVIGRQVDRLIGADQMGVLFRACCLHSAGLAPPGFAEGR